MAAMKRFGVSEPPPYTASPVPRYLNTEHAHAGRATQSAGRGGSVDA
jgi:hypothetical protein